MTLEEERDFYHVWFEYLIRTPSFLRWADWKERICSGENIPWPTDLSPFLLGYGAWFNHDYPWEISFDRVYSRVIYRKRLIEERNKKAFTPSGEIAWYARQALEVEREELGRSLSWKEDEEIIERVARETLERREIHEKEYEKGSKKYRYRSKPPGVNWGPVLSATLKRRLTYYLLAEVCGLSRGEIVMADYLPAFPAPFGLGPFSPNPREIDFFRYWKKGHADCRDPRHFLSEEIAEARKVIAAVEKGWFPAPPPLFRNSRTVNPPAKFP